MLSPMVSGRLVQTLLCSWFVGATVFLYRPSPALAADRNELIFAARYYRVGQGGITHYHLYTIRPNGQGKRQLTFGKSDDTQPEWLPEGHTIRFHRSWQNRPDADGWCTLDVRTGAIHPIPTPPPYEKATFDRFVAMEMRLKQALGKDCQVYAWGSDRFVALTFQGTETLPSYGEVPANVKEIHVYGRQGELLKAFPVSVSASLKERFAASDRPLDHLRQLTPLPGDEKRFLLGCFYHRAMANIQVLVDTEQGTMRYWANTDAPQISPDGKWFVSRLKSGQPPRGYTDLGKRRNGKEIIEYVSDVYISPTAAPDTQRALITGEVHVWGVSWNPVP